MPSRTVDITQCVFVSIVIMEQDAEQSSPLSTYLQKTMTSPTRELYVPNGEGITHWHLKNKKLGQLLYTASNLGNVHATGRIFSP